MWVFDATPLIYLAKIDRISIVEHLDEGCCIPERVYTEVVADGLDAGYPDARRIERCVEADLFDVVTVEETQLMVRLRQNPKLSEADCAVLACAFAHAGIAAMDEEYGRTVATTEGVTTRGTAYLILHLVAAGDLSTDDARTAIDEMLAAGWYCAPDLYSRLRQKLEELEE